MDRELMTAKEAGRYTGLSACTLRKYAANGKLKPHFGRDQMRFHRADIDAMLIERAKLPAYLRQIRGPKHG